jgi:hypothetical protein
MFLLQYYDSFGFNNTFYMVHFDNFNVLLHYYGDLSFRAIFTTRDLDMDGTSV